MGKNGKIKRRTLFDRMDLLKQPDEDNLAEVRRVILLFVLIGFGAYLLIEIIYVLAALIGG